MLIKVIAVLCKIASPGDCHEALVTTSELSGVTFTGCKVGMPELAAWMGDHPGYTLASWHCVAGNVPQKERT
jgi:hypothetical protein